VRLLTTLRAAKLLNSLHILYFLSPFLSSSSLFLSRLKGLSRLLSGLTRPREIHEEEKAIFREEEVRRAKKNTLTVFRFIMWL